jgi:predicted nucleic acid-binding protein
MPAAEIFFDSSVLLYLLSGDAGKADRVETLVAQGGHVSVQVLNEFAAVARGKLALSFAEIREILATIRALCRVQPLAAETHDRTLIIAERYKFSIFDSAIVASALLARCKRLYTEDLQHRQRIDDELTVINPFL